MSLDAERGIGFQDRRDPAKRDRAAAEKRDGDPSSPSYAGQGSRLPFGHPIGRWGGLPSRRLFDSDEEKPQTTFPMKRVRGNTLHLSDDLRFKLQVSHFKFLQK